MKRPCNARGFTLIELMIVVAIVGILSSIAIPSFQKASLRAKKAERDLVLNGVSRAASAIITTRGAYPRTPFTGTWNPATPPGTGKLPYNPALAGWNEIDFVIEGALYHQYQFVGITPGAGPITLAVVATGDLDGDATAQQRTQLYTLNDGALEKISDTYNPVGDAAF